MIRIRQKNRLPELGGSTFVAMFARVSVSPRTAREHDERVDELTAIPVGHADGRILVNSRMLEQRGFDFWLSDVISSGDDHIVGARVEAEVTCVWRIRIYRINTERIQLLRR
jgi:hypothetical protein